MVVGVEAQKGQWKCFAKHLALFVSEVASFANEEELKALYGV